MKKFVGFALILTLAMVALPAFAVEQADGAGQIENVKKGAHNVKWGWVEVMDHTGQEAAKGKGMGEELTGVVAGSAIGVRKGIHRIGAGAIDLLTFWIPKKTPLITPEEPRLK